MKKILLGLISRIILGFFYTAVALLSAITQRRGRKYNKSIKTIAVVGTFHNPNWFHAHITPLTMASERVVLICDEPVTELPGLVYACPPALLSKLCSRALAKFIWGIWVGFKYKPDLYMGYHIFPAALTALALARIFNRPACYQCTAGPLELEGGGWAAENRILVALGGASPWVERRVNAAVREFDLVVVRGSGAQNYVRGIGYKGDLEIITGSVDVPEHSVGYQKREADLIFVGRLTEYKRPDRLFDVIGLVAKRIPNLAVHIVGDGPDQLALAQQAERLGITDNIRFLGQRSDVQQLLGSARVFMLTSRWEGLSIAMMEAMVAGAVPVVADVGDLKDFVKSGDNGYVVEPDDIATYAAHVESILGSAEGWSEMSDKARELATQRSSREAIAARWRGAFDALKS